MRDFAPTILHVNTAPADGDLANGDVVMWLDATTGAPAVMWKAKDAAGTVTTGGLALTGAVFSGGGAAGFASHFLLMGA